MLQKYCLRLASLPRRDFFGLTVGLCLSILDGCGGRSELQPIRRQQTEPQPVIAATSKQEPETPPAQKITTTTPAIARPLNESPAVMVPKSIETEPTLTTGDVVRIEVVGEEELTREVTVPRNGIVAYPLLKSVALHDKTVLQLTRELTGRLSEYLVDPAVNIHIVKLKERTAYLYSDQIARTLTLSPYEINVASRLLLGAGLPADIDLSEINVVRKSQGKKQVLTLNLSKLMENYEAENDLVIQSGDLIVLPKSPKIYVQGAVNSPGAFPLQRDQQKSLGEIFLLTQGASKDADLEHVKILREGNDKKREVLIASASPDGYSSNVPLKANDIVIVPSQESNFVTVYGEIKSPGEVKLNGKKGRLATVLAKAGGLTDFASKWISVIRHLPSGESKKIMVNYNSMVAGEAEHDIEVMSQDVIFIDSSIW
jgi:polysaccharide export outer membrane protein